MYYSLETLSPLNPLTCLKTCKDTENLTSLTTGICPTQLIAPLVNISQEQPRRPQEAQQEPIKYDDAFLVSGDLAEKPIAPQDAAMLRSAEATVFGETQRGGPAAAMQAAARVNERAGLVGRGDVTDVAGDEGVSVTATQYPGTRIITESVAGQGATGKLPADKAATREDAEGVITAEMRNNPNLTTHPGVAASVATAAKLNEGTI